MLDGEFLQELAGFDPADAGFGLFDAFSQAREKLLVRLPRRRRADVVGVVFRRRAQADVANNTTWLEATQGLLAADRWRVGLLTAVVGALETDPHRYPQADDAADVGVDLRELLHGSGRRVYRVLFTIDGNTVNILRVRHATQDRLTPGDI